MMNFLFLILCSLSLPSEVHDIHVSICDIEIEKDKVEITVKTFIDDLQIAVGLTPGQDIPSDYTSADDMISSYLKESMLFTFSDDQVDFTIVDLSASNDAVWISLEAVIVPSETSRLSFSNSFLTEIYDDQTNIVNIKINGKKKTYSLNKKTKRITHDFTD